MTESAKSESVNTDDKYLEKELGYKQELFRGLQGYQNFALCFAQVAVTPGICAFTYGFGLIAGGPSTIVWSWIACWFASTFVAFCLAEICGAFPSCGSVYHWAAQLVPPEHAPLASYITGWLNLLANSTSDAIQAFAFANWLNAALIIQGYTPYGTRETVGVAIAILFAWSLIACLRVDLVGHIGTFATIVQFGCLIIVPITLLCTADSYQAGNWVFTQDNNYTGWENQSYASAIGVISIALSFAGYDAAAHVAEETINTKKTSPRNITLTVFFIGACGLFVLLAMLFTTPSIDSVLDTPTASASANLFMLVAGNKLGKGLVWLLLCNFGMSGCATIAISGRIAYALCRDNLFPYSKELSYMHPTIKAPVNCLAALFLCDCCVLLLCLDKTNGIAAYYSIVSLCSFGFFASYIVPVILKQVYYGSTFPVTSDDHLGAWSVPFGIFSILFLGGVIVLTFLPSFYPVKVDENMNWECVVVTGAAVLIGLNWLITGQYNFKGPVRSIYAYGYSAAVTEDSDMEAALKNKSTEKGKVVVTKETEDQPQSRL